MGLPLFAFVRQMPRVQILSRKAAEGEVFDYIKEDLEKNAGTGNEWIRRTTPYDPAKECRPKYYHGVDPTGLK